MRIIGGQARGRRLLAPTGRGTRPTADRVREAMFSMVAARRDLGGARVLDLFAGSGALGLEALSRGAIHCTFVEADRRCCRLLAQNAAQLELAGQTAVLPLRVEVALGQLGAGTADFDLVLADPPYADDPWPLLAALSATGRLAPEVLVVVEHAARREVPERGGGLRRLLTRRYGDTAISLFARGEPAPEEHNP
jgi:16S rRNA (guanine966-N2)-methyltransferase